MPDIELIKQAVREVLNELIKEKDICIPRFISVDVPVPKFTEYAVKIPVIEEVFYTKKENN